MAAAKRKLRHYVVGMVEEWTDHLAEVAPQHLLVLRGRALVEEMRDNQVDDWADEGPLFVEEAVHALYLAAQSAAAVFVVVQVVW